MITTLPNQYKTRKVLKITIITSLITIYFVETIFNEVYIPYQHIKTYIQFKLYFRVLLLHL